MPVVFGPRQCRLGEARSGAAGDGVVSALFSSGLGAATVDGIPMTNANFVAAESMRRVGAKGACAAERIRDGCSLQVCACLA